MAEDQRESAWPDLPPELLGLILCRLPSLADRVRAAGVCRPWRSFLNLPWLAFGDGTLFDLANDSAPHPHYRVQGLPGDAFCCSAGDNMFFLLHPDGSCSLMNALSGATTPLPELAANLRVFKADQPELRTTRQLARKLDQGDELRDRIRKVVVLPSSSASDHPIVAVLVRNHGCELFVSTCRPAGEINSLLVAWTNAYDVVDIAPFQGKIYVLSRSQGLTALEVSSRHLRTPRPPMPIFVPKSRSGVQVIQDSPQQDQQDREDFGPDFVVSERYLVESSGKLLMVRQWVERDDWTTCDFEVWEADLTEGRWKEFDGGLDGRALFLSKPCSKSLPAGHGVREDCIYFLNKLNVWKEPEAPLGDSGVYSITDEDFTPLLSESTPLLPWENWRFPAWFFPLKV
ncbi:hypothetical protein QYE76_027891 [Lolium multiflorum]|uniref:F-box domain-containing protein n=1 Tax=Lolium multiflorum TaxID=4521 RepID=A0AAD8VGJ3_LOLMU|nr:hypothetical protein QYE76_027891 [Lolium multiflorum]